MCFIATSMRRERVLEVGGFDTRQERSEDVELWLRVIEGHTWAFNSAPTAAHQEDTPGSITKNAASCELFILRAYQTNQHLFRYPEMEALIRVQARRTVSCALTDGDASDRAMAFERARGSLGTWDRCMFRVFGAVPGLYRAFNRIRRWILKPRFRARVPSART